MEDNFLKLVKAYLDSARIKYGTFKVKTIGEGDEFVEVISSDGITKYIFAGVEAKSYYKGRVWKEEQDLSEGWQNFVINSTFGKEKLDYLDIARERKFMAYEEALNNLIEGNLLYEIVLLSSMGGSLEDEYSCLEIDNLHSDLCNYEEKVYNQLVSIYDQSEDIESIIRTRQAKYLNFHAELIKKFLDEKVNISINEKGEEVFDFTEELLSTYEYLMGLKEDTDFFFRSQLYRYDQLCLKRENEK